MNREPVITPVQLKNRFLKHWSFLNLQNKRPFPTNKTVGKAEDLSKICKKWSVATLMVGDHIADGYGDGSSTVKVTGGYQTDLFHRRLTDGH